jgi:hypothetical protein
LWGMTIAILSSLMLSMGEAAAAGMLTRTSMEALLRRSISALSKAAQLLCERL